MGAHVPFPFAVNAVALNAEPLGPLDMLILIGALRDGNFMNRSILILGPHQRVKNIAHRASCSYLIVPRATLSTGLLEGVQPASITNNAQ